MTRRLRTPALLCALVIALAGASLGVTASAGTGIVRTVVNADGGIYWRSQPNWNTPVQVVRHGVYNGDRIELECYERGGTVPPYYNNPLWYQATIVSGFGIGSGLVNDHFVDTGINQPNIVVPGVPPCGGAPTRPPTPAYNRSGAVDWALAHAQDPQPFSAACTWFASNALWQGGLPKSGQWTDQGNYGFLPWHHRPGTATANAVDLFAEYLLSNHMATYQYLGDLSNNRVPQAQLGDIIVYSWDGGATWQHVAVIVNIASGQYPEVSEWGATDDWNVLQAHPRSSYQKRGWTWSANKNKWLQVEYNGKVRAYLLHISY